MRQTAMAEVRSDAGRTASFNVSAQSTGWFDRLLRKARSTVAQAAQKGQSGVHNHPESEECRSMAVAFKERTVFAGCVRDSAEFLPHVLQNVDRIAGLFSEAAFIFVENDSRDGTKSILSTWARQRANVNIVTLDGLAGVRARTQRLEVARNTYVERVRADERLSKFEFLVVIDCDNVNAAPVDLAVVSDALSFLKSVSDIAGVFSNSRGLYFDLWALRHRTLCPGDIWEEVCDYVRDHDVADGRAVSKVFGRHVVRFPSSQSPVEVDSAFGGLGIYKLPYILRNPNPYQGYKMKVFRDKNQDWRVNRWQRCEHVHFNLGIRSLGGRLFIIPQLINVDSSNVQFPHSAWRSMLF